LPGTLEDLIVCDIDSKEEEEDDEETKTWLANFYGINIAQYFQDHKTRKQSNTAAQFFKQHFGVWFHSSTYSDHLKCGNLAPQSAKDAAVAAG
jgi:hypothetical protein